MTKKIIWSCLIVLLASFILRACKAEASVVNDPNQTTSNALRDLTNNYPGGGSGKAGLVQNFIAETTTFNSATFKTITSNTISYSFLLCSGIASSTVLFTNVGLTGCGSNPQNLIQCSNTGSFNNSVATETTFTCDSTYNGFTGNLVIGNPYYLVVQNQNQGVRYFAASYYTSNVYSSGSGWYWPYWQGWPSELPGSGDYYFYVTGDNGSIPVEITTPTSTIETGLYLGYSHPVSGTCSENATSTDNIALTQFMGINQCSYSPPSVMYQTTRCENNKFIFNNVLFNNDPGYSNNNTSTILTVWDLNNYPWSGVCTGSDYVDQKLITMTYPLPIGSTSTVYATGCEENNTSTSFILSGLKQAFCWLFIKDVRNSLEASRITLGNTLQTKIPFAWFYQIKDDWDNSNVNSASSTVVVDFGKLNPGLTGLRWQIFDFDNQGWNTSTNLVFDTIEHKWLPGLAFFTLLTMIFVTYKKTNG